jgi:hypothetical protein
MYCLTCEMPSSENAEMVLSRLRPILALLVMVSHRWLVGYWFTGILFLLSKRWLITRGLGRHICKGSFAKPHLFLRLRLWKWKMMQLRLRNGSAYGQTDCCGSGIGSVSYPLTTEVISLDHEDVVFGNTLFFSCSLPMRNHAIRNIYQEQNYFFFFFRTIFVVICPIAILRKHYFINFVFEIFMRWTWGSEPQPSESEPYCITPLAH